MKVMLVSLLLASSAIVQACKTCYYYEQRTSECQNQKSECPQCRYSACDPSSELCGSGNPTWELLEDYYDSGDY